MKALALNYPPPAMRIYMDHNVRNTPDAATLFEYKRLLLFVCDGYQSKHEHFPSLVRYGPTLMEGYSHYPTVFTMQGFNLFYDTPTKTVVPLHAEEDKFFPCAKIKGQLHLVRPELLVSLDIKYGNGVQFKRRRVKLLLPYRRKAAGPWKTLNGKPLPRALQGWRAKESSERIHIIEASMYVGRKTYWDRYIDGGYSTLQCPIQFPNIEKNWLPRYYEYTRTFEEAQRDNR